MNWKSSWLKTAAHLPKFMRKRKKIINTYYLVLTLYITLPLDKWNYVCVLMHISVCIYVYPYIYREWALRSLTLKSWKVCHSWKGNNQTQVCVYNHNSPSFGTHSSFFCPFVPLQSASQPITLALCCLLPLQPGPSRCVIYLQRQESSLPPWEVLRQPSHSSPELQLPGKCRFRRLGASAWLGKTSRTHQGQPRLPEGSVPVHSQNKIACHRH